MMQLLLLVFICYRITLLIVRDQGPYNIFGRIRAKIYANAALEQTENPGEKWGHWENLANLIECPHCAGLWVAIVMSIFFASGPLHYASLVMASAGFLSMIFDYLRVFE